MKKNKEWSNMNLTDRIYYYKKYKKNNNLVIYIVIFTIIVVSALITSIIPSLRIKEFEDYMEFINNNFVTLVIILGIIFSVIFFIKLIILNNKIQKSFYFDDSFLYFLSANNIECDSTDKDIFDDATFYEDNYILKTNDIKTFISGNLSLFNKYCVTKFFAKYFSIILAILIIVPFVIALPNEGVGVLLYPFLYFQLFSVVIISLLMLIFILLYVKEKILGIIGRKFLDEVNNEIDIRKNKDLIKEIVEYYKLLY